LTMPEKVIAEWEYQTDRALVCPYVGGTTDGGIPEDFLVGLYYLTKKDGLLRSTFPGGSDFSLTWFVSYFTKKSLLIGIEKPGNVAGYSWIYEVEGNERFKKGAIGMCFFKKFWGSLAIRELSQLGLRWYFQELGLNIIFATVAARNRLSFRFSKNLGFQYIGRAPMFFVQEGNPLDIDLMFLKREDFMGGKGC